MVVDLSNCHHLISKSLSTTFSVRLLPLLLLLVAKTDAFSFQTARRTHSSLSCPNYTFVRKNNHYCPTLRALPSSIKNEGESTTEKINVDQVEWKLKPRPESTSKWHRLLVKIASNLIRLDAIVFRKELPPFLCPKGGQAVLEGYFREPGKRRKTKIARFGITTQRGPSSPLIEQTIRDLLLPPPSDNTTTTAISPGIAAIIYMFIEPSYRGHGVGERGLQVINAIHAVQGCDFTILVADDDGSGKLVEWYEGNGYVRAPKLQEMMGSPGGKFGVSMICPVGMVEEGFFERCRIKWW